MSREKKMLLRKFREELTKADLYSLVLDFKVSTMAELVSFAHQLRDTLKGRRVSTDIPDRRTFFVLVAINQ